MSRKINIQNGIGIFDGYILDEECDKVINHFEEQDKFQKTFTRDKSENASVLDKKDNQLFLNSSNLTIWKKEFKTILANFDIALKHYEKETGILNAYGIKDFEFCPLKIQKTLPSQGYHVEVILHLRILNILLLLGCLYRWIRICFFKDILTFFPICFFCNI